jgi:transcription initiation factor IIE alpha subunit
MMGTGRPQKTRELVVVAYFCPNPVCAVTVVETEHNLRVCPKCGEKLRPGRVDMETQK